MDSETYDKTILAKSADGRYDPDMTAKNLIAVAGGLSCPVKQPDLNDQNIWSFNEGEIAINTQCVCALEVETVLTKDEQIALLNNDPSAIELVRQSLVEMYIEGLSFGQGAFVIVAAPIPQLVGNVETKNEETE
jgi:hypothetical protein